MKIRFVQESDLAAIAAIYNYEILHGTATFDTDPKTPEDIRAWLCDRGPFYPSIVALEDEKVLGFAGVYPWSPRKAYERTAENTVYVDPSARGRGIGRTLLGAILEEGRRAGLHSVIARISAGNDASLKLHEELGFQRVGTLREVGTKFGRLLDVRMLQLIF